MELRRPGTSGIREDASEKTEQVTVPVEMSTSVIQEAPRFDWKYVQHELTKYLDGFVQRVDSVDEEIEELDKLISDQGQEISADVQLARFVEKVQTQQRKYIVLINYHYEAIKRLEADFQLLGKMLEERVKENEMLRDKINEHLNMQGTMLTLLRPYLKSVSARPTFNELLEAVHMLISNAAKALDVTAAELAKEKIYLETRNKELQIEITAMRDRFKESIPLESVEKLSAILIGVKRPPARAIKSGGESDEDNT